ncbi:tetratricopeptide repeat-containing sensor histidine kinase [Pedobacter sp. KR3-3]|uniref:histidine kinase n=1 Tax=Pedobacter albus TaxID=3113905 RepID=A0ABU7I7G4_9SPHI|nr:tetratricopeptide repeat-containing sensor histidine kinase [Pedobacter sp. KR3-3]MEE1945419.1 tetratricopeptide repeat-containing sensor histidine kinase [Pedobacter sp. KR3-3]
MFPNARFYFVLWFCCCCLQLQAKQSNDENKKWLDYATRFYNRTVERGIFKEFDSVIVVARKGVGLTAKNDYHTLSAYSFFIGHTYKVQLKNDSAFFYLEQSARYGILGQNMAYEVMARQQINYLNRYLGRFEETKPHVKRLHQLLPLAKDDAIKDRILSALSEEYLGTGDYHKAISYILESLPLKEKILAQKKDYTSKVSLGLAYASLGNLYLQLHQNQNALNSFKLAAPYFERYMGAKIRLYINFEQVYLNMHKVDSAKIYYDKVYGAMVDKKLFYARSELSAVNRLFASYYLDKDIELAKKYATKAYQLGMESESKEAMLYALNLMGNLNYELKDYHKAVTYLEKALPGSYSFSKDVYASIMLKLAQSYEKLGNNGKALKYYKDYNALSSKIYQDKSDEQIANIEFKYKNAEKEKQIDYLSNERLAANKLLKQKNQLQLVLIIAFGLALLVIILIYRNYRNKNKSNVLLHRSNAELDLANKKLAEANQTKARLFGIISHDLRSPVSQLFTFLKLQQTRAGLLTEDQMASHQKKLIQSSTALLATMEDLLLWSKTQMEHFELHLSNVAVADLFAQVADLLQSQADAKEIQLALVVARVESISTDANLLLIILRNLVQNAINNSFEHTTVELKAGLNEKEQVYIAVTNKGEVIPNDQLQILMGNKQLKSKSSGYGLLIVKELAVKINAQLAMSSTAEHGTEMVLVFGKE